MEKVEREVLNIEEMNFKDGSKAFCITYRYGEETLTSVSMNLDLALKEITTANRPFYRTLEEPMNESFPEL